MRIASYNINGVKARLPRLLEWLEETRPSVACLQEVKSQDEGFPAAEFEKIGYHAIWHGQKGFNGVAILTDGETGTAAATCCRLRVVEWGTAAHRILMGLHRPQCNGWPQCYAPAVLPFRQFVACS